MRRTAGTPAFLKGEGLNAKAVQENRAFMVYSIIPPGDPRAKGPKGHSKFYEVLIVEDPPKSGIWTLYRVWGSIGDPRPRVKTEQYSSLRRAQSMMSKYYQARMKPGKYYVSAFGAKHVTTDPTTGKQRKLRKGEYPLTHREESPGFGHGHQQETSCIPALHHMVEQIDQAVAIMENDPEATYAPDNAIRYIEEVRDYANELTETDMGAWLQKAANAAFRRAMSIGRFKPDPGNSKLVGALKSIKNYIIRSNAYC
jgi:hypothetical protein